MSEWGMTRSETLIELKFVSSSFSSSSSYWNITNSSPSSDSRQRHLSQQYPPPLLIMFPFCLPRAMWWFARLVTPFKTEGAQMCFHKARRHQMCHFRKRATSAPAEGPAYGLDLARHCEFPLRTLQAQKWHGHGCRAFGAT